ncbi:MAG: hypothetical protein AAF108_10310 [Planctomycetota bacterium]
MTNEPQSNKRGLGFTAGGLVVAACIAGGTSAMISPASPPEKGEVLPPFTMAELEQMWKKSPAGHGTPFDATGHAARRVNDHFRTAWPDLTLEAEAILATASSTSEFFLLAGAPLGPEEPKIR